MKRSAALAALAATALLVSCASAPRPASQGPEPHFIASQVPAGVALVLSGGTARGYAHVGVIKVLEAHGLRPDMVVGTSAGSIVGALYASGLNAAELEAAIAELGRGQFGDFELPGLGILPGSLGVVRGDRLHRFIDDRARHHRIEDFPLRFAAVATDLATGEPQIFNAGDVGAAGRASSAMPGIMTPAEIGGRLYADGQLSSPVPVDAARRLGARVVIAVDVVYPPQDASPRTALGVILQAFAITVHRLKSIEVARADAVITPELGRVSGQLSFGDRDRLIAAGELATHEAIARLRPLFHAGGR